MKELFGFSSALRMLSIFPCFGEDCSNLGRVLGWAPAVGAVISILCTTIAMWSTRFIDDTTVAMFLGAMLAAVMYLGLEVFLSRGFHLDGLADSFDGWGGGWTKERTLEIMRDSHIGSFGTLAIAVVLMVKLVALCALCFYQTYQWLVMIPVFSRLLMVYQAAFNGYARADSGSLAGNVVTSASGRHFAGAVLSSMIVVLPMVIVPTVMYSTGMFVVQTLVIFAAGLFAAMIISYVSNKRIGGVTGDVLGATVEICEAVMMWSAALMILHRVYDR